MVYHLRPFLVTICLPTVNTAHLLLMEQVRCCVAANRKCATHTLLSESRAPGLFVSYDIKYTLVGDKMEVPPKSKQNGGHRHWFGVTASLGMFLGNKRAKHAQVGSEVEGDPKVNKALAAFGLESKAALHSKIEALRLKKVAKNRLTWKTAAARAVNSKPRERGIFLLWYLVTLAVGGTVAALALLLWTPLLSVEYSFGSQLLLSADTNSSSYYMISGAGVAVLFVLYLLDFYSAPHLITKYTSDAHAADASVAGHEAYHQHLCVMVRA